MKTVFWGILLLMIGMLPLSAENASAECMENILAEKGVIITYPEWKLKALSFSYDDGNIADRRLVGIFNKYGMKATFHIPSGWLKNKPKNRVTAQEIPTLYAGHEISGHGANHRAMGKLKPERVVQELDQELRDWPKIIGKRVIGYAYPYGNYSPKVIETLKKKGYLYGRIVKRIRHFDLPSDFFLWTPQAHHNQKIAAWGKRYLAFNPKKLSVLLIWGHSYEFPKRNNWQVIEDFCKMMSGKDDICYATMEQIARYVADVRSLQLTSDGRCIKNVSSQKIYFMHNGKKLVLGPGKTFTLSPVPAKK